MGLRGRSAVRRRRQNVMDEFWAIAEMKNEFLGRSREWSEPVYNSAVMTDRKIQELIAVSDMCVSRETCPVSYLGIYWWIRETACKMDGRNV